MKKKSKAFLDTGANGLHPQRVVEEQWGRPDEQPVDPALADVRARQVKSISIFDIMPDRTQPRRAIPEALRSSLDSVPELLDVWMLEELPGRPSDEVYGYFASIVVGREVDRGESDPTLFDELLNFAAEIYRDGLINPVTLDNGYRLETGERRWLCFHLLHLLTGEERWAKIPARLVERVDRFRQAAENSQRTDLNMVARSRQWALLMMDAWEQQGRTFAPYEDCSSDRAYYAQVHELYPPDGMGTAIMNACGVKSRAMLSKYRAVLGLSDDQWIRADEENWSYGEIEGVLTAVNTRVEPTPPLSKKRRSKPTFEGTVLQIKRQYNAMGEGDRRRAIQLLESVLDELRKSLG